jgi:hypothetical protein
MMPKVMPKGMNDYGRWRTLMESNGAQSTRG